MQGNGGNAGRGACMAGACMVGGMHGRGFVHGRGACVARSMDGRGGGHVWEGMGAYMVGVMCGKGHVCHTNPADTTRYGRSMHGQYASYSNAFLF